MAFAASYVRNSTPDTIEEMLASFRERHPSEFYAVVKAIDAVILGDADKEKATP